MSFFHGTLLEKNLAARIEHQHMHRAMPQPARMNLASRVLSDYLVALVDHVKNFFAHAQKINLKDFEVERFLPCNHTI